MFNIKTESLELRLEVAPVGSLLLHEEILPDLARELFFEFKNWTNLQNPIIVDDNHIVLDGNHRAFVFKQLKFKYIPVCRIDYFHEKAELKYWFRLLTNIHTLDRVREVIREIGGNLRQVGDKAALRVLLHRNHFACGIQHLDYYGLITFPKDKIEDAVDAYDYLEKIQKRLTAQGVELGFIPCQHVLEDTCREAGQKDVMIIWTPHMTKEMVVEAAKKGKLFAPKSTRHCIPARPLNVNVPTTWFKEDLSLGQINERFMRYLKGKKIRRFGPGQVIEGRYYGEEVFVFYDET